MPVPAARALERHLLRDTAYSAIRDAIVDGTLAPDERLHDVELCAWLNLSRTPVREALSRLEDEGLVETIPQRFTRVRPVLASDAHDCFPLLAVLHALATELAVPNLERADIEELRSINKAFVEAMDRREAVATYAADQDFHDVFVRAAGNHDLVHTLERMSGRLRRLELLRQGALPGRRSAAQHEAIIDRAAKGDARGAASATRENWLELGSLVERSLTAPAR
jgi:DNA-binding GntR family transcriptional regulator